MQLLWLKTICHGLDLQESHFGYSKAFNTNCLMNVETYCTSTCMFFCSLCLVSNRLKIWKLLMIRRRFTAMHPYKHNFCIISLDYVGSVFEKKKKDHFTVVLTQLAPSCVCVKELTADAGAWNPMSPFPSDLLTVSQLSPERLAT